MNIIYLLIGLVVGAVVGFWIGRKGKVVKNEEIPGIGKVNQERKQEIERAKEKIVDLFGGRDTIANAEVQKLLGVSEETAFRYLDELEKDGKIEQVGALGRNVEYRLKTH